MEEKIKIAQAIKRVDFVTWISAIAGVMFLVAAFIVIYKGIDQSNCEIGLAETLNRRYAGEHNLYPSVGIDYELEARVVSEDTVGGWYHDLIAAEYGDVVEIRLKVVAANPCDIDSDSLRRHTLYMSSSGLELLSSASSHAQVTLPDGTLADYPDDADDSHIAYIAVGVFRFTNKDWWMGRSSSAIIPMDPDMVTKLEVIAPLCDVDVTVVAALLFAAAVFGIVLPFGFIRSAKYTPTLVYSEGKKVE